MKTLTLDFTYRNPVIRLKGLSFKSLGRTDVERNIYIEQDIKEYCISADYKINSRTAQIEQTFLINCLKQIREKIHFDKIKIISHYEMNGDQLMNEITKND